MWETPETVSLANVKPRPEDIGREIRNRIKWASSDLHKGCSIYTVIVCNYLLIHAEMRSCGSKHNPLLKLQLVFFYTARYSLFITLGSHYMGFKTLVSIEIGFHQSNNMDFPRHSPLESQASTRYKIKRLKPMWHHTLNYIKILQPEGARNAPPHMISQEATEQCKQHDKEMMELLQQSGFFAVK